MLQQAYEIYAGAVIGDPFHTPGMPIRTEAFDTKTTTLLGGRQSIEKSFCVYSVVGVSVISAARRL